MLADAEFYFLTTGLIWIFLVFLTVERQAARSHLNHFDKKYLATASKKQLI